MLWIFSMLDISGLLLWLLVHGSAKCRSSEYARALDDEQMRILSEMRKGSR